MPIAAAITGIASALGQRSANKKNLQIAREQMAFQERLSSTAHQREVKDLRKAGLNPILSAMGGSGSSTPAGASATMQNEVGPAVTSALATKRLQQDLHNLKANENLTKRQTEKVQFEKAEALARIKLIGNQTRAVGNAATLSDLPADLANSAKNVVDKNRSKVMSGTHPLQEKSSIIINDLIDSGVALKDEITSGFDARRKRMQSENAWVTEFKRLNGRYPTRSETKKLFDPQWRN